MFVVDAHSQRVTAWLRRTSEASTLSDWTLAEFTSVVAIGQRGGRVPAALRASAELTLNAWIAQRGGALAVESADIRQARSLIQASGAALRAPDALHLAIAMRHGCVVATFDEGLRRACDDLGVPVATI